MLLAWGLGLVVFIDDYLNALVLGRTLRPVADRNRVPRERLAYVIDSTAAPMCLLVPISTWAVYVAGLLETTGAAPPGGGLSAYVGIIPFAFYGWFAVLLVPLVSLGWIPAWGAMRRADERVAAGGSVAPPGCPWRRMGGLRGFRLGTGHPMAIGAALAAPTRRAFPA